MKHTAHRAEIERIAGQYRLDPDVVEAMVLQESGGDEWAWNPEPHYRYFWDVKASKPFRQPTAAELASQFPPRDFPMLGGDRDQEWWAQQASFGLLQVMGAVAREQGFRGVFLTELCQPTLNLDIGCQFFAVLLRWAKGDTWQAVAAYNGGRGNWRGAHPQAHVAKVQRFYTRLSRKVAA
jgi:hypothetical protein